MSSNRPTKGEDKFIRLLVEKGPLCGSDLYRLKGGFSLRGFYLVRKSLLKRGWIQSTNLGRHDKRAKPYYLTFDGRVQALAIALQKGGREELRRRAMRMRRWYEGTKDRDLVGHFALEHTSLFEKLMKPISPIPPNLFALFESLTEAEQVEFFEAMNEYDPAIQKFTSDKPRQKQAYEGFKSHFQK